MRHLLAIPLLITLVLIFSPSTAQQRDKTIPIRTPALEDINPPYEGKWGWHKAHKRAVRSFQKRTPVQKKDVCSRCHISEGYKIFDPHTQLNANGEIIKEKCLYCHPEKPDEQTATYNSKRENIKFKRHLKVLCLGCHIKQYDISHPVNANHMLEPKPEMYELMRASEKRFDIRLPLNYEGKIMCATCHNPHEKGVIPEGNTAAKGAGEKFRVRLIDKAEDPESEKEIQRSLIRLYGNTTSSRLCLTCHEDKTPLDVTQQ
jgi:hypothetical protein